ncbi:MAG: amidohydrolase family protein [Acidimicrobiales bacterium]
MVIDAYSHVCPSELLRALADESPSAEAGALRNSYLWDADRRLRYMDRVGIDAQVLVLVRPPMWLGMERPVLHRLTRVANDSIAAMAAAHPDRLIGVGVLPVVDDVTIEELHRVREELGMKGVLIFSNIEGKPLDDESMWPLYEAVATHDMVLWIHPQHGETHPWVKRDLLDRIFGWPFETTLAMARLVYGGVFERYPDIKFVTHHLGGMIPYYAERVEALNHEVARYHASSLTEASEPLKGRLTDHFRRFYNDTNVNGSASALRCGLDFFGPERLLFGTDFPMGPNDGEDWPVQILESLRALDVAESERALMLAGNCQRLLGLPLGVGQRQG